MLNEKWYIVICKIVNVIVRTKTCKGAFRDYELEFVAHSPMDISTIAAYLGRPYRSVYAKIQELRSRGIRVTEKERKRKEISNL